MYFYPLRSIRDIFIINAGNNYNKFPRILDVHVISVRNPVISVHIYQKRCKSYHICMTSRKISFLCYICRMSTLYSRKGVRLYSHKKSSQCFLLGVISYNILSLIRSTCCVEIYFNRNLYRRTASNLHSLPDLLCNYKPNRKAKIWKIDSFILCRSI